MNALNQNAVLALEPHPISLCWPRPDATRYAEMKADIARQGQLVPIQLYEGKVLDGKTRLEICTELGIAPITEIAKVSSYEEALALAVSLNDKRRDLTLQEREFVAARIATMKRGWQEGRPKDLFGRPKNDNTSNEVLSSGLSNEEAAKIMKVTKTGVERAKLVINEDKQRGEGPKLEEAIKANAGKRGKGSKTLAGVATEIAQERQKKKRQAAAPKANGLTVGQKQAQNIQRIAQRRTYTPEEIDPELAAQSGGAFLEKYGQGPYYKSRIQYETQWDNMARQAARYALKESAKLFDAVERAPSEIAWRRWLTESPGDGANLKQWLMSIQRICRSIEGLKL